ncbi:tetratricopeptide repeat protein [bacterium]|nr:tetratricopeptide repeat protein [bacterium]
MSEQTRRLLVTALAPQIALAVTLAVTLVAFSPPVAPTLATWAAAALVAGAIFAAWHHLARRGLIPRGRPIRPFRPAVLDDDDPGADNAFVFGPTLGGVAPPSQERIIEDYIETARTLLSNERFGEAEEILKKALELEPGHSRLLNFLGLCLSRMARYDEAVRAYELSIEQDYDNASAHFNLAVAMENAERISDAAAQYQRYLRVGRILGEPEDMLERAEDRLRFLRAGN